MSSPYKMSDSHRESDRKVSCASPAPAVQDDNAKPRLPEKDISRAIASASHALQASPLTYPPGPLLPSPLPREPAEPSPTADASHDLHLYSNFIRPTTAIATSTSSLHRAVREDLAQHPGAEQASAVHSQPDQPASVSHLEPSGALALPPPNFSPFFTLIRDAPSGDYIHPSVYYVFADDDPEVVTTAALHALETDEIIRHEHAGTSQEHRKDEDLEVEDRYILLDLDPSGTLITQAQSLSSQWAVTSAMLEAAPVFGGQMTRDKQESEKNSTMLIVEGMGAGNADGRGKRRAEDVFEGAKKNVSGADETVIAAMTGLHAGMEERMHLLDSVMAGLDVAPA